MPGIRLQAHPRGHALTGDEARQVLRMAADRAHHQRLAAARRIEQPTKSVGERSHSAATSSSGNNPAASHSCIKRTSA